MRCAAAQQLCAEMTAAGMTATPNMLARIELYLVKTLNDQIEARPAAGFPYKFRTAKKKAPDVTARCLISFWILVGAIGLEPTTPTMSRWCSNQLSYAPEFVFERGL